MSVSDASILGEGLGLGGRDTAGRYVCERESWPRALFSLRLSGRQAAKSRAVPLRIRTCGSLRESLYLYTVHSLYLYSRFLYSIHHSQSSQSVSIYDREIGAKISVSISISRFLRLENLLYTKEYRLEGPRRRPDNIGQIPMEKMLSPVLPPCS